MKTVVENIILVVNEFDGWDMTIEYDKLRQFYITLKKPHHCIEIVEMQMDELTEMSCDATTQFFVYRNDELMWVGNDMYWELFLVMLHTTLELC